MHLIKIAAGSLCVVSLLLAQDPLKMSVCVFPDPFSYRPLEEEPVPLNLEEVLHKARSYPHLISRGCFAGKVFVRVLVRTKGQLEAYLVLRSPHPIVTEAVESTLHYLRFSPGCIYGIPVRAWTTVCLDLFPWTHSGD
jgi:hypothetical protein